MCFGIRPVLGCLCFSAMTMIVAGNVVSQEHTGADPQATHDNFHDQLASVSLAKDADGRLISVSGLVRKRNGEPVPDAVVVLRETSTWRATARAVSRTRDPKQRPGPVADALSRTRTDKQGRYRFVDVRVPKVPTRYARSWTWEVVAAARSGEMGWKAIKSPKADDDTKIDVQRDIVLRDTAPIEGKVESFLGAPVADAKVSLGTLGEAAGRPRFGSPELNLNASSLRLATRTDAKGRFRFPACPSDLAARVFVEHSDEYFEIVRIAAGPLSGTQTISERARHYPLVSSPATVRGLERIKIVGRVRSETGVPLQGFVVRLGAIHNTLTTDVDGRFTYSIGEPLLRRVAYNQNDAEILDVTASDPDREFVRARVYVPLKKVIDGTLIDVIAKKGVRVTGHVLSKSDRQPVPGVTVTLRSGTNKFARSAGPQREKDPLFQLTTTNESGAYSFVLPRAPVWIGVGGNVPGYRLPDWRRHLESRNVFRKYNQMVDMSRSRATEIKPFFLEAVAPYEVRVVDDSGTPVADAVVTSSYVRKGRFGLPQDLASPVRTDEDGTALLSIGNDEWTEGEARAEIEIDGVRWNGSALLDRMSRDVVTIKLRKPWTITGRVTVDGKPVAGISVRLSRRVASTAGGFGTLSSIIETVETDQDGVYRFTAPAKESYTVSVNKSPIAGRRGMSRFPHLVGDGELRVEDIDFTAANGIIRGLVKDTEGNPIPGALISVDRYIDQANVSTRPPQTQVPTDAKGRFELTGLPDGRVRLHIYHTRKSKVDFLSTIAVANVGEENVAVLVDRKLERALPKLPSIRVVPADSVPRLDPIAPE